jgi:small subunit ribosomal protein S3
MDAGARGVEIIISGKVTSQRARTQIFRAGTMSKSGQPAQEGVDKGVAQCIQKSGVLGIIVKIMRANTKMGDDIKIKDDLLSKAQAKEEIKLAKTRADYMIEVKEGELSKEDKKLLDEVDEKEISEISINPDKEDPEEDSDNE